MVCCVKLNVVLLENKLLTLVSIIQNQILKQKRFNSKLSEYSMARATCTCWCQWCTSSPTEGSAP